MTSFFKSSLLNFFIFFILCTLPTSLYAADVAVVLGKGPVAEAGKISASSPSLYCDEHCLNIRGVVAQGTIVNLRATAGAGFLFKGWTGAYCSGTDPDCSFVVSSANSAGQMVQAVFQPINPVTLSLSINAPQGLRGSRISAAGTTLNCSANFNSVCAVDLPKGYKTEIHFQDNDAFNQFSSYSGVICDEVKNLGDSFKCAITLDQSREVVGNLTPASTVIVKATGLGLGSATGNVPLIAGAPQSEFASFLGNDLPVVGTLGASLGGVVTSVGKVAPITYWNPSTFSSFVKLPVGKSLVLTQKPDAGSVFKAWNFNSCTNGVCTKANSSGASSLSFNVAANTIYYFSPQFDTQTYCNYQRTIKFTGSEIYTIENVGNCVARSVQIAAPTNCINVKSVLFKSDTKGQVALSQPAISVINTTQISSHSFQAPANALMYAPLSNQYWPVGINNGPKLQGARFNSINLNIGAGSMACEATVYIR